MRRRSSTKPPPELTFFTDRDLGKRVPAALRAAGIRVERHDDHFPPDTPDTDWLERIGTEDWVALTHNKNIRYVRLEKEMVLRAGVRLFVLIGHHTHDALAQNFVNTFPLIEDFLAQHTGPFIAKVFMPRLEDREAGKPGRVEWWWPES